MKKGQAWALDLTIASIIFLGGIILFYFFSLNYPQQGTEKIDSMQYEGEIIAQSLLSEGNPEDWNINNVVTIGILSGGRINETKLGRFYNMANETITPGGYANSKSIFKTQYEYHINLSAEINISGEIVAGIGKSPENPENIIKITRLTIYEGQPVSLNLFIWE